MYTLPVRILQGVQQNYKDLELHKHNVTIYSCQDNQPDTCVVKQKAFANQNKLQSMNANLS